MPHWKILTQVQDMIMNGENNANKIAENRAGITVVYTDKNNRDFNPNNLLHPYYWGAFILIGNGL